MMDPSDPSSFNLRNVTLSTGRHYRFCDEQPAAYVHGETPVLILLHGFPEFCECTVGRHLEHFGLTCTHPPNRVRMEKSNRSLGQTRMEVIAPDMLGYSGTVSSQILIHLDITNEDECHRINRATRRNTLLWRSQETSHGCWMPSS